MATEDEMVGRYHQFNSTDMNLSKLGVGEGQGSLACCSPWGWEESNRTGQVNNNISISISISNMPDAHVWITIACLSVRWEGPRKRDCFCPNVKQLQNIFYLETSIDAVQGLSILSDRLGTQHWGLIKLMFYSFINTPKWNWHCLNCNPCQ